ncbi:peptidogalycan biosysnthesis protein [Corynebacterium mastitidis]|nr:peptidogalycan biosysnthesis protein [Corynebacterium mastitidis]MCH6197414.1 peptidogalycan biosysnthesis protein [Corynebacterium mastitidis]
MSSEGVDTYLFKNSEYSIPCFHEPGQSNKRYTLSGICAPQKTLLVGNRRGYDNFITQSDRGTIDSIESEVLEFSASHNFSEVWYPFLTKSQAFEHAKRLGTVPVLSLVSASFETGGKSHEYFLKKFSKKKRNKIRKERSAAQSSSWSFYWENSSSVDISRFCQLLANVEEKHGKPTDVLHLEKLIERQLVHFGEKALFATCAKGNEIAVQALIIHERGKVAARSVGIDYDLARRDAKYFETTYYMPIDLAHQLGAFRVELGPGTLHAKSIRGASLSTRWWVPLRTSKSLKELKGMNVKIEDIVADQDLSPAEIDRIDLDVI